MADQNPKAKKRQLKAIKKTETVREKAVKASAQPKTRRIKQARGVAAKPFRIFGRGLRRILRPFRFLLWPFRLRPVRFVGRILAAVLLLRYFRNSWRELRQVVWPDTRQTAKLTFAVFMFAIFVGALITAADYGLDKVFKKLILK